MSGSGGAFVLVATYPDEATAQQDYQVVKDAHAAGLVGSYDAAVVTKDASGNVHENKDETATRHGAWWGIAAGAAIGVIFPPSLLAGAAAGAGVGGVSGHWPRGCRAQTRKSSGTSSTLVRPGSSSSGKVEDAIKHAVTRAEKQTAKELGVDPKDVGKALQETVKEM